MVRKFGLLIAIAAVLLTIAVGQWRRAPALPGGMLVPEEPFQSETIAKPFYSGRYRITPLQNFKIRARVLGVEPYAHEDDTDLMPFDFALGWGPMSDTKTLDQFRISQNVRHVFVNPKTQDALPFEVFRSKIANIHICPDREWIHDELAAVKPNTIIQLKGWLIRAEREDGYRAVSSTSRDDWKGGACEILWVRKVTTPPSHQ